MWVAMEMHPTTGITNPVLFAASPHFSDGVNRNIIGSEIEGGVYLHDLSPGSSLSIETRNRVYELVILGDGAAMISGHPEFCLAPTKVQIHGSTWGGSLLKMKYVGRGMHLEFEHPQYRRIITSKIVDIRAH